jgi:hypothetical protein
MKYRFFRDCLIVFGIFLVAGSVNDLVKSTTEFRHTIEQHNATLESLIKDKCVPTSVFIIPEPIGTNQYDIDFLYHTNYIFH